MQPRFIPRWRFALALFMVLGCDDDSPRNQGQASASVAESSAAPTRSRPSPAYSLSAGPAAIALDAGQTRAAEAMLTERARLRLGDAEARGSLLGGQFATGQSLAASLPAREGACYSALGLGLPPVAGIALALRSKQAPEFGDVVVAKGRTPAAVLGKDRHCLKWKSTEPGTLELLLTVESGQGVAFARIYEKR